MQLYAFKSILKGQWAFESFILALYLGKYELFTINSNETRMRTLKNSPIKASDWQRYILCFKCMRVLFHHVGMFKRAWYLFLHLFLIISFTIEKMFCRILGWVSNNKTWTVDNTHHIYVNYGKWIRVSELNLTPVFEMELCIDHKIIFQPDYSSFLPSFVKWQWKR